MDQPRPDPAPGSAPGSAGSGARWRRWARLATVDPRPLRRRDFRLLFAGQAVSLAGSMITYVALPYQVFALTRSSLAVGLLGVAELAPLLATALLGGALADARDRRRMAQLTELGLALTSALLVLDAALPRPRAWPLYLIAAAMAALDGLQRPSLDAMTPRLVPKDELAAAGALQSLRMTLGMIAGPALAGLLIAGVGLPATYGVDVASFAVSLVALWLMRAVPPPPDAARPSLRGILDGFRYARSRQELLGTYLVDIVAMLFGMPMALFPAIAARYGGAGTLGLLYSAPSVGSMLASATSGWTAKVRRHGMAIVLAAASWCAAVAAFGVAGPLWLALALLLLAGAADMVSGLFRQVIWNQTIPDDIRGRLAGIEMLSWSIGPLLGNVEAGGVAALWSVQASVVSGGLAGVAGVIVCAASMPRFRAYHARHAQPAADEAAR